MSIEKDPNGNKFIPYMREDRLPHIFCPGCGNGSIMNIELGNLKRGEYRSLTDEELNELYEELKGSENAPGGRGR